MATMQLGKKEHEHIMASMKNQTLSEMCCGRYINFVKSGPGPWPPATIKPGKAATFNGFVAKGAVVYVGHNREHDPTAWVLSWDTTNQKFLPSGPNTVFVACASKSVIDQMSDDEILIYLNAATSPEATTTDPITKTTIHADLQGLIPEGNSLIASFGLVH